MGKGFVIGLNLLLKLTAKQDSSIYESGLFLFL